MQRVKGWEKAFSEAIRKHQRLPSQYGVSDCYKICDDVVEAITGEKLFPDIEYTSPIGAAKELMRHGFENVEQAFASRLEAVPIALSQRGDIAVAEIDGQITGGVITQVGFFTRGEVVPVFLPLNMVKTAFKVGR